MIGAGPADRGPRVLGAFYPRLLLPSPHSALISLAAGRVQGGTSASSLAPDGAGLWHLELTPVIMGSPVPQGQGVPLPSRLRLLLQASPEFDLWNPSPHLATQGSSPLVATPSRGLGSQLHNPLVLDQIRRSPRWAGVKMKREKQGKSVGISPCSEQGGCYVFVSVFMVMIPRISP